MSSKASPTTEAESAPVKTSKPSVSTPTCTKGSNNNSSTSIKSSPKLGSAPPSAAGGARHSSSSSSSSAATFNQTDRGAASTLAPTISSLSKVPTGASTPVSKGKTSRTALLPPPLSIVIPVDAAPVNDTATTETVAPTTVNGKSSANASIPPPPPSVTSAPTREESYVNNRGWDPLKDGRFRVALRHHFAEDMDEEEESGHGNSDNNSVRHPSSLGHVVPDDLNPEAAAVCEEEAHRTPTHGAFCNSYYPGEPCVEVDVEASLVNAINSAYTSTGYPFVVTTGSTHGAVYGAFVDTSNPTLSSLEMPPAQLYIVAPTYTGGQVPSHGLTEMDTLLAIQWGRGDRMMTNAGSAAAAAVAASQSKSANSSHSSISKDGKGGNTGSVPRPGSVGPAGTPHSMAVARTIAHHLIQYPEGIHGIHTSMDLRRILVEGKLPTERAAAPSAPANTVSRAPLAVAGGNVGSGVGLTANSGNSSSTATNNPEETAAATQLLTNAEANVPPLPRPPESNAPVQHTLVSASTFNHLSVYIVAHQDGKMLYTAALQSLSASIATRKVTAHQLILVGREEVKALMTDPLEAVTSKPERRTKISFTNVPVKGGEAAVFFQSKTSRFIGADASSRTVSAAPVRFTVEPHLLFGNQNGDIFVFSLLQERIVQHINFNAGSHQVSPSIASGSNSGVGSKLICSPVSSIVEVQNGIEKKITSMIEYATVAKRNRRAYFECDDVPCAFTPTNASEPSHYYYPVPPSLYAVGFDNGQMLLLCVTCEGGWMLRHFSSQYFGLRPIHSIAVRVAPFFTRLWTSCLPAITSYAEASATTATTPPPTPITALITAEQMLIVHEDEQHIGAVACNGGVIVLVRLPGIEIISSVAPTDYNAVGEILALQWTSTSTRHLLTPDVLVASGEDDTMTAFQLLTLSTMSAVGSSYHLNNNNGLDTTSYLSSNESLIAGGRLRILEKKKFHRSWVNRLHLFPIVLPATSAAPSRGGDGGHANSSAERAACATGGGMPQYLGVCLLATSYDRRTSFWPYIFAKGEDVCEDGNTRQNVEDSTLANSLAMLPSDAHDLGGVSGGSGAAFHQLSSVVTAPDHYVLVDGPTAAYPLHTELVVSVAAAGGGTSFFLITVCCRGKVKFWSMKVKV